MANEKLEAHIKGKLYKSIDSPTQLDQTVAQALIDIERENKDIDLFRFQIISTREIDIQNNPKKALVIFYPYVLNTKVRKMQSKLTSLIERKMESYYVFLFPFRRILSVNNKRYKGNQNRPRNRALTNVYDKMLEDLIYPSQIAGRRTCMKMDQTRLFRVHLEARFKDSVEEKLPVFSAVYRKLTNRKTEFSFPEGY
ncbi:40S ribosomal protein, variant 2 [Bonamia ostreae]|uniref:40S ribosomal protein S7 n=1 Tax=Bonamia ostreae TaxID=126728 RepID=A0ABV2AMD8_9EUKA